MPFSLQARLARSLTYGPKDLAGREFGSWTVVEASGKDHRGYLWRCRCKCGVERRLFGKSLTSGQSTGCRACMISPGRISGDLAGSVFGGWTVIKFLPRPKDGGGSSWLCRCDCGHERKLNPRSYILRGRSANCEKCLIVKRKQTVESFFWKSIKNNAERRKINFSVSQQFIFGLLQEQGFLCALTGLELFLAATVRDHTQGATTASLDRIDSSKGYTETNVQWLHKDVNKMKMDIPESRFIELCRAIAGYADRRILRESVDNNPAPCA